MEFKMKLLSLLLLVGMLTVNSAPTNSVNRCSREYGRQLLRFEALPGGGWDNLRNRNMGQVMDVSYSECQTTEDGRFLIPDNIEVVPMKTSNINKLAELFEHWDQYTSSTSASINAHGSGLIDEIGISGKFSGEYQSVKSHQYYDKSITARVQVRFTRYQAMLKPGAKVSHEFKRRLRKIAALHTLNATESARYESQLIVHDFGTHVVTSIDAGAILSEVDHIQQSDVKQSESQSISLRESVGISFFGIFDFGVSSSFSKSTASASNFRSALTSSQVVALGGPSFKAKNFSAGEWSDNIENNLVAIDRSGDPLYMFVNEETLPNVPSPVIFQVYNYIRHAVNVYYKHNTYFGCTHRDSTNFNFMANSDDGTCSPSTQIFHFGGLFQTCSQTGSSLQDECAGMTQTNPVTNSLSCPRGFNTVLIQEASEDRFISHRSCHRCYLFFHCCKDDSQIATIHYSAYWCMSTDQLNTDQRLLFGGTYTDSVRNLFTQSKSCPKNFVQLNILKELHVCVSTDTDSLQDQSLPFGGIFSCNSANPLAVHNNSKFSFGCPKGYSQHLAGSENGCDIHVCIKSSVISTMSLPGVILPPFMNAPKDSFLRTNRGSYALSKDGTVWTSIEGDGEGDAVPKVLQSYISIMQADSWYDMQNATETTKVSAKAILSTHSSTPSTTETTEQERTQDMTEANVVPTCTSESTTMSTHNPAPVRVLAQSSENSKSQPGNEMSVVSVITISVLATISCLSTTTLIVLVYRKRRSSSYTRI